MKEYKTLWNKDFICICLIQFLFSLSNNLIGSIVTSYAEILHSTAAQAALLAGIFYAVSFVLRSVVGPVQSSVDEKKILIGAYTVGLVANLGYAIAPSYGVFVCFRLLQGVQMAFTGSVNLSICSSSVPRDKVTKGIGYFGLITSLAGMAGPIIGINFLNILTSSMGPEKAYRLVFFGAAMFMLASLLISLLISPRGTPVKDANSGVWYKNILDVHAIFPSVILVFQIMSYSLYISYLMPFANEVGIANISPFYIVSAAVMLCTKPFFNKLTERVGLFRMMYMCLAVFTVSFVVLATVRNMTGVIIAAILGSATNSAAYGGIQTLCVQSVPSSRRAVASNTCYLGMDLGFFLGPIIFGGWIYPMVRSYAGMYLAVSVAVIICMVLMRIYQPIFTKRRAEIEAQEQHI